MQLLQIGDNVARLRQCLKDDPRYLQDKVRVYFKVSLTRGDHLRSASWLGGWRDPTLRDL